MCFKTKPSKVKYFRDSKTIDELHKSFIHEYYENQKIVTTLKKQLKEKQNSTKQETEIKKKIDEIDNNNKILVYFSCVGDLIVKHYDSQYGTCYNIDSDAKTITNSINFKISPALEKLNELNKQNQKIKKPVKKRTLEIPKQDKTIFDFLLPNTNGSIQKKIQNKPSLIEQYLMIIDKSYAYKKIKICPVKYCSECGIEKTLIQSEGCYVCQKCGETEHIIVESEIPSHKEALNEKPKYPYKKLNHLKEKLNQFQSKELADIPYIVYENINNELKKQHINPKTTTPVVIRKILKQYKHKDCYEHLQQIYCKISGKPPIVIDHVIEEKIIKCFNVVLPLFRKKKPTDRSNFLNYSYFLNKIFRILNLEQYSSFFPLLISPPNLQKQDKMWEPICLAQGWKFYKSI